MIRFLRTARKRDIQGTALLRLDMNTEDAWRIRPAFPTVQFLMRHAEKTVVVSHRGRPRGAEKELSLRRASRVLSRMAKRPVIFVPHFRFGEIKRMVRAAQRDSLFVLENLRFLRGEERNSASLARPRTAGG